MREIDARVTGFDYTTFHAYTTEVEVDGHVWTLALRYNTFFQFYTRLTALEKHFNVDFPPKGGLFFSPPPEERQEQLDDFLLSTLAYFDMRGHPKQMGALLSDFLEIPQHMDAKEDEEEDHTASEGSSVAGELRLDTPIASDNAYDNFHDHDDAEEDQSRVQSDNNVDNCDDRDESVEVEEKTEVVSEEEEPETKQEVGQSKARSHSEPAPRLGKQESQELTGGAVAKNYIDMLRRRSTLVNGAIQAAVVATMQENVKRAKAAQLKGASEVGKPEEDKVDVPEREQKLVAPLTKGEPATSVGSVEEEVEIANVESKSTLTTESLVDAPVDDAPRPVELEPVGISLSVEDKTPTQPGVKDPIFKMPAASKDAESGSTTETEDEPAVSDEAVGFSPSELSDHESAPESSEKEAEPEAENPVVSWFRRMGTFGQPSLSEKEEAVRKEEAERQAAAQAEAQASAEAAAKAKSEEEAQAKAEAAEADLFRAEQEINLRLMRYRHPVFFQGFNCDVGTSRYSLPARLTDGIVV
ncbi:hypothetical protein PHYBOEH_000532 [Phytophthora boehmeriae]|uniref:PX domain-containing protein n=1 Tax=Phytophthora boehmeriae TaxID=109152 RepID=A0A8T1X0P1_9STRA|nr:hypothetical protein PHYBOEH_000532 [Phytophthora boehmeriae]